MSTSALSRTASARCPGHHGMQTWVSVLLRSPARSPNYPPETPAWFLLWVPLASGPPDFPVASCSPVETPFAFLPAAWDLGIPPCGSGHGWSHFLSLLSDRELLMEDSSRHLVLLKLLFSGSRGLRVLSHHCFIWPSLKTPPFPPPSSHNPATEVYFLLPLLISVLFFFVFMTRAGAHLTGHAQTRGSNLQQRRQRAASGLQTTDSQTT